MDREEIIKDYRAKHAVLEAAFFETPEIGREHRKLREGRSIEVFDRSMVNKLLTTRPP